MARGVIQRKHKGDYSILIAALILLGLSSVVIYSLSPALANLSDGLHGSSYFVLRQLVFSLIGLAAFGVAATVPVSMWQKYLQPIVITLSIILLIALLFIGVEVNGATRWINVGGINVQPSEFVKIGLLLYLASWLTSKIKNGVLHDRKETLYPIMAVIALVGFLIVVVQNDLGTMIAILAIVIGALYAAGVRLRDFAMMALAFLPVLVTVIIAAPHRVQRITSFLPGSTATAAETHHIDQALIAVGSGGLFGRGVGKSVSVHGYLPEAETDSIFAILAENFGFIGTIVVLGVYSFLLMRLYRVVERAPTMYMRIIGTGILAWILAHIVINVSAMLGLAPITGITLPLLSIGGTSLIVMMGALGMMFQLSKHTQRGSNVHLTPERGSTDDQESSISAGRRRNGRPYYAASAGR